MGGSWLVPWHPRPHQHPLLVCVPPAGAGCGQFGAWQTELGEDVSVVGVQLPGRETRWMDPKPSTMEEAVDAIVTELTDLVPAGHPTVLFGHSFGALLGYEIARSLWREWGAWPRALVVAACRPPREWVGVDRGLVDDEATLTHLLDSRGLDTDDMDVDSQKLMLDVLRQDALLSLSYVEPDRPLVGCALEAWGGRDDLTVSPQHVTGWRDYADGEFQERMFPGGHYFCLEEPSPVLNLLGPMARWSPIDTRGSTR
ncbi:MAG: hypothetical protein QOG75_5465 [Mycobacterium sp.]|jgi:surfactin synthase thioesterase subunit|nr:hypothetical protein [Mycobacterium sp.]